MAPFGFDAMMQMQRPALAAMAEMNGRLYESITAVNKEWVTFVNRCLKEERSTITPDPLHNSPARLKTLQIQASTADRLTR